MINITEHAQDRMVQRDISLANVITTLKQGRKISQYDKPGVILSVTEAFTVVYAKVGKSIDILTVYGETA